MWRKRKRKRKFKMWTNLAKEHRKQPLKSKYIIYFISSKEQGAKKRRSVPYLALIFYNNE
jgi:hypothetical protein